MKGYLQRMAASAIKPAQSVQPALGTLFGAPRSVAEAEPVPGIWPELTNAVEAEPQAPQATQKFERRAARPAPHAEADRPTSPIGEPDARTSRTIGREADFPDRPLFEPLVEEPAISRTSDLPMRPATASESGGDATRPAMIETGSPTEVRTETQVRIDTRPLVVPILQVRERHDSTVGEPRAQRSAPAKPDEVHIHIGRIEVTAVPAPAPPAIRKLVRKSPTLDEYLRRSR
jgi:hypothetical protein